MESLVVCLTAEQLHKEYFLLLNMIAFMIQVMPANIQNFLLFHYFKNIFLCNAVLFCGK